MRSFRIISLSEIEYVVHRTVVDAPFELERQVLI